MEHDPAARHARRRDRRAVRAGKPGLVLPEPPFPAPPAAPAAPAAPAPAPAAADPAALARPQRAERRAAPVGHRSGRRRARATAARLLVGLPTVLALALLAALGLPVLFGCRSLVVMSGSMQPAISTGSVVIVKQVAASGIAVGDVVSFRNPEDTSEILTHRVRAVETRDGRLQVETRGDANTGGEKWSIDPAGTVGRVVFKVPYLGYLLAPLQGRLARLALVVAPALLLGAHLVFTIWRAPVGPAVGRPARQRARRRSALRPARIEGR